jgi:hypothetical protein
MILLAKVGEWPDVTVIAANYNIILRAQTLFLLVSTVFEGKGGFRPDKCHNGVGQAGIKYCLF